MAAMVAMLCRPCEWMLRDVRDLVREHTRELGLVARRENEAVVHADEAARQRERVDRIVAYEEKGEALCRIAARLSDDAGTERVQVFGGFGVFDDLAFIAQLTHDLQADAVFVIDRQRRGGRAADVGQVVARVLREGGGRQQDECRQEINEGCLEPGHRRVRPRRTRGVSRRTGLERI
jgi:hypothetical protein